MWVRGGEARTIAEGATSQYFAGQARALYAPVVREKVEQQTYQYAPSLARW